MATSAILLGLLLAAGSGAAWSVLDALRKRLVAISPLALLLGLLCAQVPIYALLVAVTGVPSVQPSLFAWAAFAGACATAANVMLTVAVREAPLGLVVPLLSFTPVLTVGTGWVLLGQRPTTLGAAGVALVVAGALWLHGGGRALEPLALLRHRASRLGLGVAGLFAVTNAVERRAVLDASEPFYALTVVTLMALALGCVPSLRRELAGRRVHPGWLVLAGAVMAVALMLQLFAFRFLLVAYVDAVKRATSNLSALLYDGLFFGEALSARRLGAVGLMSAGVGLLLLGQA